MRNRNIVSLRKAVDYIHSELEKIGDKTDDKSKQRSDILKYKLKHYENEIIEKGGE